jgi:hypothetical protein
VTCAADERRSWLQYLQAEIRYYLEFATDTGGRYALEGRKDHATLYGRVYELGGREPRQTGAAYLKVRTFEDFLRSFQVTGTEDPLLRTQGLLRFLAFTAQRGRLD